MVGSVQWDVTHLRLDAVELEQVALDPDLQKDHIKLNIEAENERLTAAVALKSVGTAWQVELNHKGKMDLAALINQAESGGDESQAPLDIEMQLTGKGNSLAELLESVEGRFMMVVGEGKLSEKIARHLPFGSVLYGLVGSLLPEGQKSQPGKLECAVVQLHIAGIATSSKGLALRTDRVNVLSGGALNLRTGEIDLRFKTAQRKGIGIGILGVAERLVDVTGTLNNPTITPDLGRAVTFGAAAWATAGISVLADSIFTRLTAFQNPCDAVLQSSDLAPAGN